MTDAHATILDDAGVELQDDHGHVNLYSGKSLFDKNYVRKHVVAHSILDETVKAFITD